MPDSASDAPRFIWPTSGQVSQEQGVNGHPGIDINGPGIAGRPVGAAARATVSSAGWNSGGYGNLVILDHGGGWTTYYAHLVELPAVGVGQTVEEGQFLGKVGSTGHSTGPHLHFEIRQGGVPKNPRQFIPGDPSGASAPSEDGGPVQRAQDAWSTVTDNAGTIAQAAIPEPLRGLVDAFAFLQDQRNWRRLALISAGGSLITMGLVVITRDVWVPIVGDAIKVAATA